MERQLQKTPYVAAKALFQELQHRYPGRFPDGQLRTFQRRVKDWRVTQANKQNTAEMITEPFSGPENGELG